MIKDKLQLNVVTFNILAPVWVSPAYYPCVDPTALDTTTRLALIIQYIEETQADVVALQEVQGTMDVLGILEVRLGMSYYVFTAMHGPTLWSEWLLEGQHALPTGNAVLVRKALGAPEDFTVSSEELSDDGNTMVVVQGAGLRIFSVHLETLKEDIRVAQIARLFVKYPVPQPGVLDILAGDLNAPQSWLLPHLTQRQGAAATFVPAALRAGSSCFNSDKFGGDFIGNQVDHVMLRGLPVDYTFTSLPADPYVNGAGGYTGSVEDQVMGPKVEWTLRRYGSDHIPVGCSIQRGKK